MELLNIVCRTCLAIMQGHNEGMIVCDSCWNLFVIYNQEYLIEAMNNGDRYEVINI